MPDSLTAHLASSNGPTSLDQSALTFVERANDWMRDVLGGGPEWLGSLLVLAGAIIAGTLLLELALLIAIKASRRTDFAGDEAIIRRVRAPLRLAAPMLTSLFMRPALQLGPAADELMRRAVAVALIGVSTWLVIRVVNASVMVVLRRHRTDVSDNLLARRVHTQLKIVNRIVTVVIGVIGVAAMLMTFPSIRQLGASLLASAGIAGLIIGLAAQRTIGNFLAGLQIALTGSINLDDVVVIDGEWGRIEEITSTYVVVRIWDERRLIVPFSRVIEESFANWTRRTADILGTVFIHVDYGLPIAEARAEVRRLAEQSQNWDGRVAELVVTEAGERTMQLRGLVSASDASKAWKLRCEVREGLVEFIQQSYPECLPRSRSMLTHHGSLLVDRFRRVTEVEPGAAPAPEAESESMPEAETVAPTR